MRQGVFLPNLNFESSSCKMFWICFVVFPPLRTALPFAFISTMTYLLVWWSLLCSITFILYGNTSLRWSWTWRTPYFIYWMRALPIQQKIYNQWWSSYVFSDVYGSILIQLQVVKSWKMKLPYISSENFKTIGVWQWLNDEVINYFVTKWCSRSQVTLGFSTFFACKVIFQESLCINARSGDLTSEDVKRAQKWCRAAQVRYSIRSLGDASLIWE